jgi:hypothetical protein
LNFSSLFANWEIDLVAEDEHFGALTEEMFEEDLTHARGSSVSDRPLPEGTA